MAIKVLATDLDGTLIPLSGNEANRTDLQTLQLQLQRQNVMLVFVTGRSFSLVEQAIQESCLPTPGWMICDVGTSILKATAGGSFEIVSEYANHLATLTKACPVFELIDHMIDRPGLRLQEPEKQGAFKLSVYTDGEALDEQSQTLQTWINKNRLPYAIISSHDPESQLGLIDLLPIGVSKAYALNWWATEHHVRQLDIAFAGDSGNDLAALTAGYRTILVSNAHPGIAEEVRRFYSKADRIERLFRCSQPASSGVLEGLLHFTKGGEAVVELDIETE